MLYRGGGTIIKKGKILTFFAVTILTAVLLSGCLGGGGGTWIPKTGDFLEYSSSMMDIMNITVRMEIKAVTDTTMTINITSTVSGMPPTYQEQTVAKGSLFGQSYDINNPPAGTNVTKVGTEQVSTKWGSRSADHYVVTQQGITATTDIWMRSGIILKVNLSSESLSMTILRLTDTNISLITNP